MAFDYTTAVTMTKSLSSLISGVADTEVRAALENHAVPRIKSYLMTATNTAGQYLFYTALSDMADPSMAGQVEALVDLVMDEPIVAGAVRRIAAAFACSWVLMSNLGIITSQQAMAETLEKQAMADLKNLAKSDVISKSIDSALPKFSANTSEVFYFALDMDPATVDVTAKTASPYAGAQQAGKVTAIINGFVVQADIAIGDTPIQIVNKLALAINAAQTTGSVNVSAAPSEGPEVSAIRVFSDTDPVTSEPRNTQVTYISNVTSLKIYPFKYDNVIDVATITIYITHDNTVTPTQQDPGNLGIVYGLSSAISALSKNGPYAVGVDLKTGKTTALSSTQNTETGVVSDSLFFQGTTVVDGTVRYSINDSATQIVDVPAGTTAQRLAEMLAQDLADKAATLRILGAVRPSTKITINGSPVDAPGLTVVAFAIDRLMSKMVFTLVSVPQGITFGVVPPTLITLANFDERTKSVVVNTTIGTGGSTGTPAPTVQAPTGNVLTSTYKPSDRLKMLLDQRNTDF
jgi:uncharacterized protein (DUF4213/DUF364 family)